jgi:hypothetical protein
MDPDANLSEQLMLTELILDGQATPVDANRLAELVQALDAWIANGGFLPGRWQKK